MFRNPFATTASLAALIAVAATSVLIVLTSLAGQRNGLRHSCPNVAACGFRVG